MSYYNGLGGGFFDQFMFTIFPILFITVFVTVLTLFIIIAIKNIKQYNKNNQSPVLTVRAKVVTKRSDSQRRIRHENEMHHHTTTTYYVTFEVESKDRFELVVPPSDYGLLVEGDLGLLTFQGTRFKSFEREC